MESNRRRANQNHQLMRASEPAMDYSGRLRAFASHANVDYDEDR
jgi:hypothetical protein